MNTTAVERQTNLYTNTLALASAQRSLARHRQSQFYLSYFLILHFELTATSSLSRHRISSISLTYPIILFMYIYTIISVYLFFTHKINVAKFC